MFRVRNLTVDPREGVMIWNSERLSCATERRFGNAKMIAIALVCDMATKAVSVLG